MRHTWTPRINDPNRASMLVEQPKTKVAHKHRSWPTQKSTAQTNIEGDTKNSSQTVPASRGEATPKSLAKPNSASTRTVGSRVSEHTHGAVGCHTWKQFLLLFTDVYVSEPFIDKLKCACHVKGLSQTTRAPVPGGPRQDQALASFHVNMCNGVF